MSMLSSPKSPPRDNRLRKRPVAGPSHIGIGSYDDTEDDHVSTIYTRPVRPNFACSYTFDT
jgi:hypothetical protein